MATNPFRFGIKKTVGAPSAEGATGIETVASHASNPAGHADYVRKGAIPRVFSLSEHLASPLHHAKDYLRRDEVMTTHLEWEKAIKTSFTLDSTNYAKETNVTRHVMTAFVLYQVLDKLGLLGGTSDFIGKGQIVTTSSAIPTKDTDSYVISYAYWKKNNTKFEKNFDTFRSEWAQFQADFKEVQELLDDVRTAAAKSGYFVTTDTEVVSGKTYYIYSEALKKMIVDESLTPGSDMPTDPKHYEFVPEHMASTYSLKTHTHDISEIQGGLNVLGYKKTTDTVAVYGVDYYAYNTTSHTMVKQTVVVGTTDVSNFYVSTKGVKIRVHTFTPTASSPGTIVDVTDYETAGFTLDEFNSATFDVDLYGRKTADGDYYYFKNPLGEIAMGKTSSPTGYIPNYVPAKSLLYTVNGTLKMLMPYSWLDPFTAAGSSEGIQAMTSLLTVRIIMRTGSYLA